MIQCALNGGYDRADHPEVTVTLDELVADAVACHTAGAHSVHLHPRSPTDRTETLAVAAPWAGAVRRVLVQVIFEHDDVAAVELARAIDLRVTGLKRPRLWHSDGRANWAVVDAGLAAGVDVRVGLEDTLVGRDGQAAPGNAGQVVDAIARGR